MIASDPIKPLPNALAGREPSTYYPTREVAKCIAFIREYLALEGLRFASNRDPTQTLDPVVSSMT
jgi:hypothetical protein